MERIRNFEKALLIFFTGFIKIYKMFKNFVFGLYETK